jgi:hypothetical protein
MVAEHDDYAGPGVASSSGDTSVYRSFGGGGVAVRRWWHHCGRGRAGLDPKEEMEALAARGRVKWGSIGEEADVGFRQRRCGFGQMSLPHD